MPVEMVMLMTKNRYYHRKKSSVEPIPEASTTKNEVSEHVSPLALSLSIIELCKSW